MCDEKERCCHADGGESCHCKEGEEQKGACHCEEYLAGWKRSQADYQNLKKEVEREKGEFVKFANEQLLERLLSVIDQYDLALSHTPNTSDLPGESKKIFENWIVGLNAVRSLLESFCKSAGLEMIEPSAGDNFNPHMHEAVGHVHFGDGVYEDGQIAICEYRGWMLNGKLLRAAKVSVVNNKSDSDFVIFNKS